MNPSNIPMQNKPTDQHDKPNLVFVFADQMRYAAMGHAHHGDPVMTPNLDELAKQGLSLPQTRSTYPVCSPYRAMLMSGRYPQANTVVGNINSNPARPYDLCDDQTCLTDVLSNNNYHVGYIGKWHLTHPFEPLLRDADDKSDYVWNEFTPPHRRHGIDEWYGYNTYDEHLRPLYWDNNAVREDYHFVDQWSTEHETDKAINFLQQRKQLDNDQPFALFVSYNPPHPPFSQVPQKYRALYRDMTAKQLLVRENVTHQANDSASQQARESAANYFAAVTGVDEQFGRIMQTLDQLDLTQDTLLVFTADHGEMMGSHQRMGKNVWQDESVRVPMIMRLPGKLSADSEDDLLLSTPDIPATLIGLLGLDNDLPAQWQGKNYAQTLHEPNLQNRPQTQFYCGYGDNARGVHDQQYTFIIKSPHQPEDESPILIDRINDPYQLKNIAVGHPKLVAHYTQQVKQWCLETGETLPA